MMGKEVEINADALVFSGRAVGNYERKDYAGAVSDFTKAIKAMPSNQNFYTMRGTAYEDMGNDIKAAEDFIKALDLLPTSYIAAYRLGMVYYRRKDFENAVKWLKTSLKNKPDTDLSISGVGNNNMIFVHKKIIASNLGSFLVNLGKYEESFKYIDKAIELDQKYHFAYMTKALAYMQMGFPEKGIPYAKKAKELGNSAGGEMLKVLQKMIKEKGTENPLNIQDDDSLSRSHKIPNMKSAFESELVSYYAVTMVEKGGDIELKEVTEFYAVSMLISYFYNAGITPMCIVDAIAEQIYAVSMNMYKQFVNIPLHSSAHDLKENMLRIAYKNSVKKDVNSYLGRLNEISECYKTFR